MTKKSKAKTKGKNDDDDVVYDDDDDEQDENEWVEDEKIAKEPKEKAGEQHAQMPENKPGKAPPDPKDQPPVPVNYDLAINAPAAPPPEKKEK